MKKKIVLSLLLVVSLFIITGCDKKKETNKIEGPVDGGWDIYLTDKKASIPEEAKEAFENASNRNSYDIDLIALLGKQVVSGTNYMFLCKDNNNHNYKIVIVYKNLDDLSQITQINYFDYTKYAHNNIGYNAYKATGAYQVVIPDEATELDEEVKDIYNKGIEKLVGVDYTPIALLGTQVVEGTNYAVLVYGELQNTDSDDKAIYLMTIYKDLEGTIDIPSISYINLAELAK